MGLIHWWPLNGDTKDYGLDPINLTNNGGVTFSTSGKIGKCAACSSGKYLTATDNYFNSAVDVSLSYWVRVNSEIKTYSFIDIWHIGTLRGELYGDSNTANMMWTGYSDSVFSAAGTLLNKGVWYHFVHTLDLTNKEYKIYKDGELWASRPFTSTNQFTSSSILFGEGSLDADFNDIRIYTQVLTPKEIKEISKALVLHYDFEDGEIEGTTNLSQYNSISGWNNSGAASYSQNDTSIPNPPVSQCKVLSITQTTAGQSAATFGGTGSNLPSKTLTASVWFYMSGDHSGSNNIGPYIRSSKTDGSVGSLTYNGDVNWRNWPNNQWIRLTTTWASNSEATTFYFCSYTANLNEKFAFNGWQIEEKDHDTPWVKYGTRQLSIVHDSSGYKNDAIIYGSPQIVKDSPMGMHSIKFDGASAVRTSNFYLGNEWSYGCWVKSASSNRSWEGVIIQNTNGGDSDMQLGFYTYPTGNVIQSTANGQYNSGIGYTYNNTWKQLFATFDGTNLKTYINGQLVNTKTISNSLLARNIVTVGARYRGGSYDCFFLGNIDDVKFYATVLSATDIQKEYQSMANLDKEYNLCSHIFNEDINRANYGLLTKNGVFNCNDLIESNTPSGYTMLDYITFTGTQFINSGISTLTAPFTIEVKYNKTNTETSDQSLFGQRQFGKFANIYGSYYETAYGSTASGSESGDNQIHTILSDSSSGFYKDGVRLISGTLGSRSSSYPALIGAFSESDASGAKWFYKGKIYRVTVTQAGNVVLNLIPAKNSSNVIGMLDIATNTFFTNAGSGTFMAGDAFSNFKTYDNGRLVANSFNER